MALGKTEQNILLLLRAALCGESTKIEIDSWESVKKELIAQAVQSIPVDVLSKQANDVVDKRELSMLVADSLRTFHNIMLEQNEIDDALVSIPFVILKGAAAAMYYPQPEYRQMGDIDLIVAPQDFEIAAKRLEEHGYEREAEIERHIRFQTPNGIEIELHRLFASSKDVKQNEVLDQMVFSAISRREFVEICGYEVPVLSKLENGLVLLSHINQHLGSGLGLRQIIDWMMYVCQCLTDDYWHITFSVAAETIGLKKLAETTTLLCKNHLGLKDITWCDDADGDLADELLEYLFDKGNFGSKYEFNHNRTIEVMHSLKKPKQFLNYLSAGGMIHWKATQKYRILKPLAPIYQIGYLIHKGFARKTNLSTLEAELKQSQEEVDFLDRLGVTGK